MYDNNINAPREKGDKEDEWFTAEEKIFNKDSSIFLNGDEYKLNTEGNACGVIATSDIGITFDNDYIHILNNISNW